MTSALTPSFSVESSELSSISEGQRQSLLKDSEKMSDPEPCRIKQEETEELIDVIVKEESEDEEKHHVSSGEETHTNTEHSLLLSSAAVNDFSCTQCGKSFGCKYTLSNHMRSHTGEKPYKCSHCDDRFSELEDLKSHEHIHSKEKLFHCIACGKSFRDIFTLQTHTLKFHERFSWQRALELLELIDGDNSDLDVSDNDDPVLDGNYQPSLQESNSEDGSDDEDPIPEPTDHSRGRKHADVHDNGSWTGQETASGSSRTLRRRRQSQEIEADSSEDDLEESTPRQTKKMKKGDSEQGSGLRWKAAPLTPNLAEYQHQDETDLDRHGWTPLDYFEQYMDRDLMMTIAECSNAMSLSKSGEPLNVTTDEIYHFFGACILMSCIRYPTIRMYWSKALKITAITDKFTRARFFKLRGAIKVVIDHDVPEDLRMSDKFWKVRPFLDRILQGCLSLNRPDCACIGEQMIPFTGACPYRQYLPMKPNPIGVKNFVCATADGIVLDFELYQGTGSLIGKVEEPEGLGLGCLVIERLCQTLHRGTKVYCDRFFTTIKGAQRMMEKELFMTGTIMNNRLAGAKHKLPCDKAMRSMGRGTSSEVSTEDGKLCVVKWYDNKPVLLMSVIHGTQPEDTCQRWDKNLKQYVTVSRPSIVREYNNNMAGVDLMDRMISYYRMSTRTKKWTMRMVMHFTDLALANSWLLYQKDHAIRAGTKTRPIQFLQFRMEVATILLAQHHGADADLSTQSEEEDSNQGVKRHVTELPHVSVRRRANAHLPEMIGLKNAMRCRQLGCTGRTRVRCMTCKVFLCLQVERNCYSAFHT